MRKLRCSSIQYDNEHRAECLYCQCSLPQKQRMIAAGAMAPTSRGGVADGHARQYRQQYTVSEVQGGVAGLDGGSQVNQPPCVQHTRKKGHCCKHGNTGWD